MADEWDEFSSPVAPAPNPTPVQPQEDWDSFSSPVEANPFASAPSAPVAPAPVQVTPQNYTVPQMEAKQAEWDLRNRNEQFSKQDNLNQQNIRRDYEQRQNEAISADAQSRLDKMKQLGMHFDPRTQRTIDDLPSHEELDFQLAHQKGEADIRQGKIDEAGKRGFLRNTVDSLVDSGRAVQAKGSELLAAHPYAATLLSGGMALPAIGLQKLSGGTEEGYNRMSKQSSEDKAIAEEGRSKSIAHLPKHLQTAGTILADVLPRMATGPAAPFVFAAEAYTHKINQLEKEKVSQPAAQAIALFGAVLQSYTPKIFRGSGIVGREFKDAVASTVKHISKAAPQMFTQRALTEVMDKAAGIDDGTSILDPEKLTNDLIGSIVAGGIGTTHDVVSKNYLPTHAEIQEKIRQNTSRDTFREYRKQNSEAVGNVIRQLVDEGKITKTSGPVETRKVYRELIVTEVERQKEAAIKADYERKVASGEYADRSKVDEAAKSVDQLFKDNTDLTRQGFEHQLNDQGDRNPLEPAPLTGADDPGATQAHPRFENPDFKMSPPEREQGLAGIQRRQEIADRQNVGIHPPLVDVKPVEAPKDTTKDTTVVSQEKTGAERRGRARFQSDEDVITAELKSDGVPDEMISKFKSKGFLAPDRVTGFTEGRAGEARDRTVERALKHVETSGEKATYVDADLRNLGGLNAKLGATEADAAYRAMALILKDELHKIGADVHLFRHGGDEMSAVVVNATKEQVDAAMMKAKDSVEALAKAKGWSEIPHTKRDEKGTGIHFGSTEIEAGHTVKDTIKSAEYQTEARKKDNNYGNGQVQAVGSGSSIGRATSPGDGGTTPPNDVGRGQKKRNGRKATDKSAAKSETGSNQPDATAKGQSSDNQPSGVDSGSSRENDGTQHLKSPRYDIPVNMGKSNGKKPISNHAIVERIRRDRNLPIEYGHTGGKDILGFYKVHDRIIREQSQEAGDLAITTHEVAHDIDRKGLVTNGLSSHVKDMLGQLDYDQTKRRPSEGFAEAVRMYITNEKQITPEAKAWLRGEFAKAHPEEFANIERYKGLAEQWKGQSPEERVGANLSTGGENPHQGLATLPEKVKDFLGDYWNKAYTWLKDEGHSLNVFNKAAKRNGYKGTSAHDQYRFNAKRAELDARTAFENGVHDLETGNTIGPKFTDIVKDIPLNDLKDFERYLWAQHALEVYDVHKGEQNPGMTRADAQAIVDNVKADKAKSALYGKGATTAKQYNDALITMLVRSGVISPQEGADITGSYKTYVPLQRVLKQDAFAKGSGGPLEVRNPVNSRTGAGLPVVSPLEAMMRNTVVYYGQAAKQRVVNTIFKTFKSTEGLGAFVHVVDTATPDASAHQFRVFDKGEQKIIQLNKDMFKFADGMDQFQLHAMLRILAVPAKTAKLGYTGLSLAFAPKNFVRDYVQYLTQKGNGKELKGVYAPAEMIGKYVLSKVANENATVELWRENGGELAGFHGSDAKQLRDTVEDYSKKDIGQSLFKLAKYPVKTAGEAVDLIRDVIGVTEVGPRLAEFRRVLEKNGYTEQRIADMRSKGQRPPEGVLIEAMMASKDVTLDFGRQGSVGKHINAIIPFFNAGLEGSDRTIKLFKENPKRAFIAAAAHAAIGLAYWWHKKDDDAYQRSPDWAKYGTFQINDDKGSPILRIPRNEHQVALAGVEALANKLYHNDPDAMREYMGVIGGKILPLDVPTAIKAPIEIYGNKNMFTGAPIESEKMQKLSPENRYNEYTTEFMKEAGKVLGMSPAKLQHLVDSYTGGIYRSAATKYDAATGKSPLADTDIPIAGGMLFRKEYTDSLRKFRDHFTEVDQKFNDAKLNGGQPTPEQQKEHAKLNFIKSFADNLYALHAPQEKDKDKLLAVDKYITGLSDYALGREVLDRYPNPLKEKGLPPEVNAAKLELRKKLAEANKDIGEINITPLERSKGLTYKQKKDKIMAEKQAAQEILRAMR